MALPFWRRSDEQRGLHPVWRRVPAERILENPLSSMLRPTTENRREGEEGENQARIDQFKTGCNNRSKSHHFVRTMRNSTLGRMLLFAKERKCKARTNRF